MNYKMLTLKITEDAHRKIKMLATYEGKTISRLIIELIEERFKKSSLPEPKKPPEQHERDN